MKSRKISTLLIVGLVVLVGFYYGATALLVKRDDEPFSVDLYVLDESSYIAEKSIQELSAEEYDAKIVAEESFVVVAHTLICPAETPLTTTVEAYLEQNEMTIYGLLGDEFRNSTLSDTVRYLPSAAIIINGEVVKYLDAESDDDIYVYQNAENFKDWLSKSIKI